MSVPEVEVPARATRRRFTAAYKLSIIDEADAAVETGAVGALLRREGLHSSHLSAWRAAKQEGALSALDKKRGRKPKPGKADAARIERLERENQRLRERLTAAETIIDVQKESLAATGGDAATRVARREELMSLALAMAPTLTGISVTFMVRAFGLSRATFYRRKTAATAAASSESPATPRPSPERRLSDEERTDVLAVLDSERFCDVAPRQVYAELLSEGTYLCSVRTMYRILEENQQVKERRNQLRHPNHAKPELIATGPNQVWSWDITKFKTFEKFSYLFLYVMLDIYSRYVVGWMLAARENASLATRLIQETVSTYDGVDTKSLSIHSDRGSAMRSLTVAQTLARLDITQSFSRPRVSNDNPFSESEFKSLKYHHTFPNAFGTLDDGIAFCRGFFPHYNHGHRHSGLAHLTPATVHFGHVEKELAVDPAPARAKRDATLAAAYARFPERFAKPPKAPRPPAVVYINPPQHEPTVGAAAQPETRGSDPSLRSPSSEVPQRATSPSRGPDPEGHQYSRRLSQVVDTYRLDGGFESCESSGTQSVLAPGPRTIEPTNRSIRRNRWVRTRQRRSGGLRLSASSIGAFERFFDRHCFDTFCRPSVGFFPNDSSCLTNGSCRSSHPPPIPGTSLSKPCLAIR